MLPHCISLLVAQSRHPDHRRECLLSEVKQTLAGQTEMSACDPIADMGGPLPMIRRDTIGWAILSLGGDNEAAR